MRLVVINKVLNDFAIEEDVINLLTQSRRGTLQALCYRFYNS